MLARHLATRPFSPCARANTEKELGVNGTHSCRWRKYKRSIQFMHSCAYKILLQRTRVTVAVSVHVERTMMPHITSSGTTGGNGAERAQEGSAWRQRNSLYEEKGCEGEIARIASGQQNAGTVEMDCGMADSEGNSTEQRSAGKQLSCLQLRKVAPAKHETMLTWPTKTSGFPHKAGCYSGTRPNKLFRHNVNDGSNAATIHPHTRHVTSQVHDCDETLIHRIPSFRRQNGKEITDLLPNQHLTRVVNKSDVLSYLASISHILLYTHLDASLVCARHQLVRMMSNHRNRHRVTQ
jgi:hypothetical protein